MAVRSYMDQKMHAGRFKWGMAMKNKAKYCKSEALCLFSEGRRSDHEGRFLPLPPWAASLDTQVLLFIWMHDANGGK